MGIVCAREWHGMCYVTGILRLALAHETRCPPPASARSRTQKINGMNKTNPQPKPATSSPALRTTQ
jgi:hypothetical protein